MFAINQRTVLYGLFRIQYIEMNEEMKYYHVSIDTSLGKKLERLMQDISDCDREAESFCRSVGVEVYLPAVEADFGGVSGLRMDDRSVNRKLFVQVCKLDGETFYLPRVQVRTVFMEAAKADALAANVRVLVSDEDIPFPRVSMMFSRQQTANMAGVELHYPSVINILRKHRVKVEDGSVIRRLVDGEQVRLVFPACPEIVAQEVTASQEEDRRLMRAMSGRMFKMVSYLRGCHRAVELYRQINALKVVPQGTLAAMLGARDLNRRPGFFRCGDMFWVTSSLPLEQECLSAATREEFQSACQQAAGEGNK